MKNNALNSAIAFKLSLIITITFSIILLSFYTSNAQNIININSSIKSNSKNTKTTTDFDDAKRSRELVLNEKVQTNREVHVNDTILLDLFSNKQYKADVEKVEVDVNGTLSIRARIIGYQPGYCFITTFNGKSFITIDIPGNSEYYSSRYSAETNTYYLLDIDKTKMKELEGSEPLAPPMENQDGIKKKNNSNTISSDAIISSAENDPETITVMVVYTPAAAAWSAANQTNINNTISIMMERSNLTHANSNTFVKLQLVHSQQVNYTELNNSNDLYNLTNTNDGFMDDVHSLRNSYAADLVMLLEVASFTGGIAWVLNTPAGSPSYGFSLTRVQQASSGYTVVHELGHNMGCSHHKAQTTQPGPGLYSYSAGGRWTGMDNKKYSSIMTYTSGSYFSDRITHTTVPHFSNPNVLYAGVATGHATEADNARTIRQTKTAIANYRNGKSNQTINAPGWQTRTFGDADFDYNITASSGLPVNIVSSNTAVATVVGNKIRILSAGSSTITATQAGDTNFNPATLSLTLTVNKANQTITFPTLLTAAVNAPDYEPGATASSGLAVNYASSNPAVATIIGGKIRVVAQGMATITASQIGNSNFNAATNIGRSLTVAGLPQTITFNSIPNKLVGDADFEIGATVTSGLSLTYVSSNPAVAIIVGTKIRILADGVTTITVSQAGNAIYAPAPNVSQSLAVTKLQQTITFNVFPNKVIGDPDLDIGATVSSGLPLTYMSSNPAVAVIVGTKIRILADGNTIISVSQPGNAVYAPAPTVFQNLTVTKVQQTITFNAFANKVFGDPDFEIGATANSGLVPTYTSSNPTIATIIGTKIKILAAGTVNITALQVGNLTYAAAPNIVRSLTINKAPQTITFAEIGFKNYNDPDFTLSATSSTGLPITYKSSNTNIATVTGNLVHIVLEGSAAITAMQVGNENYNAATEVSRDLIVGYVLPANNFRLQSTEETCKTSNNGTITITAAQALNYAATITGVNKNITQNFSTTLQTTGLEAGTYNICITVAGSSTFKQCFDAIIREPKDLSVFSSIKDNGNSVLLQLDGGKSYIIDVNGQIITTTQQEITLPLLKGNNIVKISSDLNCQGVITKTYLTTNLISLYPNPVQKVLNINTGSGETNNVKIDFYALDGRLVHTNTQNSEYGRVAIDMSKLNKGLYVLTLTVGNSKTVHKIIKD